jgi:hypothetical protein
MSAFTNEFSGSISCDRVFQTCPGNITSIITYTLGRVGDQRSPASQTDLCFKQSEIENTRAYIKGSIADITKFPRSYSFFFPTTG